MTSSSGGATVLVASADAARSAELVSALVRHGYRAEAADTARELVVRIRSEALQPTLLLSDAQDWLTPSQWPADWPVFSVDDDATKPAALSDLLGWLASNVGPSSTSELPAEVLGRLAVTFSVAQHLGRATAEIPPASPSERIYQAIFDTMSEGVAVFDARGIVRAFNAAAMRISGYTAEQMLGIALNAPKYRCVDADGRPLGHDDYPAMVCLRTRQPTSNQLMGIVRPDDHVSWVSVNCQPILVAGGDGFAGVLSTFRDVTERRVAQQARVASEATLRSFFDSAPLSMGVMQDLGDDLRIIQINAFGAQAFGISAAEMQGRTSLSLGVSPEHVALWRQNLHASVRLGSPVNFQYTYELQGQTNWLSSTVCPLTASGRDDQYCFVVELITPRVRAEETVRVQQAQLAHVQRLSALGQMASELAHELNQPLFAIGNFAAACLQGLDTLPAEGAAPLRRWLEQIAAQADRAGQIVHRLHRFVRNTPTKRQRLELGELTREALELVAVDARLNGVELDYAGSGRPLHALVDRIQVQQVLVNLVLNGIEAMSAIAPAERKLTIRTRYADGPHSAAIIVADHGRGFGDLAVERLFEPFFSTKPNGSGMGLAISREIARGLGGDLTAKPGAERGAEFTVTLPLAETADE
jgi:two-component system sensor kinase FixL